MASLQSRYYNPSWGRFINADAITGVNGALLSHNMFAYSRNNPVIFSDPSGYNPLLITMAIGAGIGGAINTGINIYFQVKNGGLDWSQVGVAALSGAASGALSGSGIGIFGAITGNAVIGGGSYAASQLVSGENINVIGLGVNTVYGGLSGLYGGAGMYGGEDGIGMALKKVNLTAINATYGQVKSGAFNSAVNGFVSTTRKKLVENTTKTALGGTISNYTGNVTNYISNRVTNNTNPATDFGYSIGFC